MASKKAYPDDRIYDDFELHANLNESTPTDSAIVAKNDAPWLNREKVSRNDDESLLEYERSFKNDQLVDNPYPEMAQKSYPPEIETRAKSARSLQRKQNKFDENYSKWAYDDEFDNEDKTDGKEATLYDTDQSTNKAGTSRLFSQQRFSNPDAPFSELLDENYPNAGRLLLHKVGKISVENKLEAKLKSSLIEPKTPRSTISEDDDVIILDDLLPVIERARKEVNKNIKISFNSEPKSKPTVEESIFKEGNNNRDPRLKKLENSAPPIKKIPVLEGSSIPTITPNAVATPTMSPAAPSVPYSNPPYYYNMYGGNVMNEMRANPNFTVGSNAAEFYRTAPMQFNPSVGWIPVNPQPTMPPAAAPVVERIHTARKSARTEKTNSEDAVKEEIRQQNKKLRDQRDQYVQKFNSLNDELDKLKKQKKVLADKKSPQAEEFLKENDKLQTEILSKIKAVNNVIDMLSKIIKDEKMKGSSSDTADEGSKKNSVEQQHDTPKEQPKSKRRHSRSRSKSRHRSRSKSRHRSRSPRGRRSRSRSKRRTRSPSRSRFRRRSRSRDKYYRRRRSNSRDRKKSKRDEEKEKNSTATTTAAPTPAARAVTPVTVVEPPPVPAPVFESQPAPDVEKPKRRDNKLSDRFKASFEEIYNRPVEPPKPPETQKPSPAIEEKPEPVKQPESGKGWARNTADSVNYVYFDPEIHWCRVCNAFPQTAKEYLLHLHSKEHKQVLVTNNLIDYPWHKNQTDKKRPTNPGAPTERIPIRGLPFFVSATAWYCKLCDQWMGDLHCASAHLKSDQHENNYLTFLESNPKWEEHWLDSRMKAYEALYPVKRPDLVTPAYSTEAYIKPTPIPPPPPPLQLRFGVGDKKQSTSSSSSSDSSSSSSSTSDDVSSHKKKKKKRKRKRNKSSVEKETKFKMVVTDARKARELAKMSHVVTPAPHPEPTTVSFNVEEEDKFVEEWMSSCRSKSKEKDLQELKKKLIKNREPPVSPAPPPENAKLETDADANKPSSNRKSPEKEKSRRDDDYLGGNERSRRSSRFDDPSKRSPQDDSRYKKSNGSDWKFNDKSKRTLDRPKEGKSSGPDSSRNTSKNTVIDRRFPFIGKMPSKNASKKTGEQSDPKSKLEKKVEPVPNDPVKPKDPLTESIQKQLAEYDRSNDVNVAVVDMDINEDEDEPVVSIVVDDNISRKKDFDQTLKLLYPENRPKYASGGQNQTSQAVSAGLPANLSQDYLVSLIRSTIQDKQLNLNDGNDNSQIMQIASSMSKILSNNTTNLADIPIPVDQRPVHISSEGKLYNVPPPVEPEAPGVQNEPEPAPPGTADDSASADDSPAFKKKKNPISQKKRRHMRKIREKLAEQEKLLQQKIEERTGQAQTEEAKADVSIESSNTTDETQSEVSFTAPEPINVMDNDLMMLGIDEEDSAALLF